VFDGKRKISYKRRALPARSCGGLRGSGAIAWWLGITTTTRESADGFLRVERGGSNGGRVRGARDSEAGTRETDWKRGRDCASFGGGGAVIKGGRGTRIPLLGAGKKSEEEIPGGAESAYSTTMQGKRKEQRIPVAFLRSGGGEKRSHSLFPWGKNLIMRQREQVHRGETKGISSYLGKEKWEKGDASRLLEGKKKNFGGLRVSGK